MCEPNYERVFAEERQTKQTSMISIVTTSREEIQRIDINNAGDGLINIRFDDVNFLNFTIFINQDLLDERKIRVLLHEYGHALHYLNLGLIEFQRLREDLLVNWEIVTEIEAMRYCLNESVRLYNSGYNDFLRGTIDEINGQEFTL